MNLQIHAINKTDCPEEILDGANSAEKLIDLCEIKIFSRVVYIAESLGKPAHLQAVPGVRPYEMILLAAARLQSARLVISLSETMSAEEQELELAQASGNLPRPRPDLVCEIMPDGFEESLRLHQPEALKAIEEMPSAE